MSHSVLMSWQITTAYWFTSGQMNKQVQPLGQEPWEEINHSDFQLCRSTFTTVWVCLLTHIMSFINGLTSFYVYFCMFWRLILPEYHLFIMLIYIYICVCVYVVSSGMHNFQSKFQEGRKSKLIHFYFTVFIFINTFSFPSFSFSFFKATS